MKQINKNTSKRIPIIISALLLVCLVAGGFYLYGQMNPNNDDRQLTKKQKSEAQTSTPKNSPTSRSKSSDNNDRQVDVPPATAPVNPSASLVISSFTQSERIVRAIATVNNAPSGGRCYFAFSSVGSKPVVQTTDSTSSGSVQSCSFSASEVSFDKTGTWQLKVTYTVEGSQVEGSQDVTIQ